MKNVSKHPATLNDIKILFLENNKNWENISISTLYYYITKKI